jgi:pimeloyl-ACP methyl ester carboxylesterase
VAEQGEGPAVVLCHGFPECWYSWRHQLPALAKAGFRAVAPDLRGFGRSDRPEAVEKYSILHDIGDLVGLVDALGLEQAAIAGHDIGATIAWQAALLRPDLFRGVIALGVPFRPRGFGGTVPPTTTMPVNDKAMFYQLFLQTPEAEAQLGRDLRRTFRSQLYTLSGDRPPAGLPSATSPPIGPGMVPRAGFPAIDPPALPAWVTEADIDVYVDAFKTSGWHGPLAWWRNIDRSWEELASFAGARVGLPALYIAGDKDLIPAAFAQAVAQQAASVPKLRPAITLAGCGHWTQQERSAEVSAAMIDFLRSL